MPIAIYCRVSTKQQTTESQEIELRKWAESHNDVQWYRDSFTGKTMDRPEWNRLEADIHAGRITKVVVWRLDRLGRTAKGLTALFDDLRARKVDLVSLRDGLTLRTPAGRLLANMLASVAEFETEVRAERVKAGQDRARKAGKTWGGRKRGVRNKVTSEQIDTVQRMHADGATKSAMARATGLSRPTIYDILAS
ncbi:MAG: recombinase family protein [Pirellulaceae bacterium]